VGKARDLDPRLVRPESPIPARDASTNSVLQGRATHRPVEEPQAEVQPANQAATESVNSSEAKTEQGEGEMVIKRTMTIDWFLPGACLVAQQQQTQGKN